MIRLIMKNETMPFIWMILVIALLLAVSSAELKAVEKLTVSDSTFHSVTLTWKSTGIASSYDIRYLTSTINTDSWDSANQVLGEPIPEEAGISQSMTFSGLLPNTTYYFAMKSCDGDSNCSTLSNVANITTDNDDFIRYIMYEDGEDGTIKRWSKDIWPPGITIANIEDEKKQSRVITFQGFETSSKYYLHLEDGNTWNINTSQFDNIVVKWSMRYSEDFFIYFLVETDCDVEKMVYLLLDTFVTYLEYNGDNQWDEDLKNRLINEKPPYCLRGLYVYHFLDPEAIDGEWHTYVRDLQADLQDEKPPGKILKVNEFWIAGSGWVDDIMFGKAFNTGDDTTPPAPPASLTAEAISSSEVNLSWEASTDNVGVTEYRIYRDGLEIGMSTTTSYADKGLVASTAYTYKVAAYDGAGNLSSFSSEIAVTVEEDTSPPAPPASLTAEAISSSEINLSWEASTDNVRVTGYRIYRDGSEIGMSTTTSYADKGLSASTAYTYKVAAYDGAGNLSSFSSEAEETTLVEGEQGEEQVEDLGEKQKEEDGTKEIGCFIITASD